MAPNLSVFQEPRGVMRILQFIFSICAFATTAGFTNTFTLYYCDLAKNNQYSTATAKYSYPFELERVQFPLICGNYTENGNLVGNFASDSQFFVATGVLSMLYTMGIVAVYVMLDAIYQSNVLVPMIDFLATVILAVFWLSGSAAWANGLSGITSVTDFDTINTLAYCNKFLCASSAVGSHSTLTISVIFGFLNFFLWASDLWFLYKETTWFKGSDPTQQSEPGSSGGYM